MHFCESYKRMHDALPSQMNSPGADDAPKSGCYESDLLVYSRHQGLTGRAPMGYVMNATDRSTKSSTLKIMKLRKT